MLKSLRALSRRKLVAALAAATIASTAVVTMVTAVATPVPAPHYRNYYSSSSYTTQVGRGMWTCQGTYVQLWGTTSTYVKTTPIVCSGDPIEP